MKTILIPVEQNDALVSILDTALLLAKKFGSYIEGFALRPLTSVSLLALDPMAGGVAQEIHNQFYAKAVQKTRELFEALMEERGLSRFSENQPSPAFSWLEEAPVGVGSYGRAFDITVLGRPRPGPKGPRLATLEASLFSSGRPILLAPPSPPRQTGENVLIAWNGSIEQTRAISFAMPLLRLAKRVTVLTVEGAVVPGPTGIQLVRFLQLNGIRADELTESASHSSAGEVILVKTRALGCDLLIKGAYTQNRFRQIVFGGATRHIVENAELPVLMAH
jgi:hypothetical protein